MSMDAEAIADRRRLRRKLSFWRVLGVLALIAAVVGLGLAATNRAGVPVGQNHIARVSIDGFIGGSQARPISCAASATRARCPASSSRSIRPGGTTTGAEELYRNIRRLAEKKPLVAFVDGTAASGGYITALAADRIVARETSLVGSIGVILQYPQVSGLLDKLGVEVEEVKSSPLKAEPSGFRPTPPEARAGAAERGQRHLRLVQGPRRDTPPLQPRRTRARVRRARVQRAAGAGPQARRRARRRARRHRLARARKGRADATCPCATGSRAGSATSRFWTWAAFGADLLGFESVGPAPAPNGRFNRHGAA